jgi:GNAT superfamily N-acetyltransferase
MEDPVNFMLASDRSNAPLKICAAKHKDLAAIAALWHRGWLDAHLGHVPETLVAHRGIEELHQRATESLGRVHAAWLGSTIVGFTIVHGDELEQLYVSALARGTGVATALLRHGESLIGASFDSAWLAVVDGNARARRFYARNGWRDCGPFVNRARVANGTMPVPSLRYEKQLTPLRAGAAVDDSAHHVEASAGAKG